MRNQENSQTERPIYSIVHTGVSGFPFGTAPIYRCIALYSMMKSSDNEVLILNNRAIHSKTVDVDIDQKGTIRGSLEYFYTTPKPYRPESKFRRLYFKIYGSVFEFITLLKIKYRKNLRVVIYYPTGSFLELLYYFFISKIFFTKLICHYVEYRSSFTSRSDFFTRMNDRLFDKYFMYFVDGAIPISRFLLKKIRNGREIPCIKIPPVVDFDKIDTIKKIEDGNYFLYVGSAGYTDAIETVISAFEQTDSRNFQLYLILSGSGLIGSKERVKRSSKKHRIQILTGLPYDELIGRMKGAYALLIPLNDRIQDIARFPNKIAEYLATGRPIVTSPVGDIEMYFTHGQNAILCDDSSVDSFSKSLRIAIENPEWCNEIGKNGYRTGRESFSTQSISEPLKEYLNQFI